MSTAHSARWVAVIPARGGSKRILNKNIIDFHGRPMIAYTIEAARSSGLFDEVVVSTDSEAIADVAIAAGGAVPFLRTAFADDQSPVSTATVWTVDQLEQRGGARYDVVVQLMPNCPLRDAEDIRRMADRFRERQVPALLSCVRFRFQNAWWAFAIGTDGKTIPVAREDGRTKRSQDLPEAYSPTGAIWIAATDALRAQGTFYCTGYRVEEISWIAGVDIDDPEDLEVARLIAGGRLLDQRAVTA